MTGDWFFERFLASCAQCGLKGRAVLVAVSGGADSVALLRLLCRARDEMALTLSAAHFEHGIRGMDSLEDMRFVQDLCARENVELFVEKGDVPGEARRLGEGLEACARRLRHAFLERARAQAGADCIALAHHRQDRAETVLMHLLRGSGLAGAAAMPARSETIVRPLIDFAPEELKEYLLSIGQPWREDATNLVPDNPRNALRLKVLPLLRGIYPGCEKALCRFAEIAGEDERALEEYINRLDKQLMIFWADIAQIDNDCDAALTRRAIRRVYPGADFDATQRAIDAKWRRAYVELGDGYRAWGGDCALFIVPPLPRPEPADLALPGLTALKGVCRMLAEYCQPLPIKEDGFTQVLNLQALSGAQLRLRQNGDYIRPFGMHGKGKSFGDYLTDRRFPLPLRERLPIVARGNQVLWAPGLGISEDARLRPGDAAARLTIQIEGVEE